MARKTALAAAFPVVTVEIEKPVYGGAFLARHEGKALFVPLALAGERVRALVVESRKSFSSAEIESIAQASPARIQPHCPSFGACGGCSYQHTDYENQLAIKQAILRETMQRAGVAFDCVIETLNGEPWGYRNRVRFAFDGQGRWGYRGRRSHAIVEAASCPIAAPLLVRAAESFATARAQLLPTPPVDELALFATADESSLIATISSPHAPKKSEFARVAAAWREQTPQLIGVEWTTPDAASRTPRRMLLDGAEFLNYRATGIDYRVDHGAFFQVNRFLVDALVERVVAHHEGSLAWDLYAGAGLFARQLERGFERVIAVESAPAAMPGLRANLTQKGTEALRADTLDFLRQPNRSLPDLIVADPPRTGLGAEACQRLIEIAAKRMVLVSCDPATLARDLRTLTAGGYQIERVTLADLFPHTFHMETVVDLRLA